MPERCGLLDMDGVIADFVSGSFRVHGRRFVQPTTRDYWKEWGIKDFWGPMQDPHFWVDLPTYGWTFDIIDLMHETFGNKWTICSDASHGSEEGKRLWLKRHGIKPPVPPVFTREKWKHAASNVVLIDDYPMQIDKFREAGGVGILFPTPVNSGAYALDPVEYLRCNFV